MATVLLNPTQTCPRCDAPLNQVEQIYAVKNGKVEFEGDGWAPTSDHSEISCANDHRFIAIYEQWQPWLRVFIGAGAELGRGESSQAIAPRAT